jgi:hypothetical protein
MIDHLNTLVEALVKEEEVAHMPNRNINQRISFDINAENVNGVN